jgi:hypothetical protein
MKGVRNTSLLYTIPLIAIFTTPIFCGNVYAVIQASSGGTEVIWSHIYPPSGGTYHYHTIGYFAWAARWKDSFSHEGLGEIYMGGSEGTTSWYCGGQQWWSQPNQIMYKIEVNKNKRFNKPNRIHRPESLKGCTFPKRRSSTSRFRSRR